MRQEWLLLNFNLGNLMDDVSNELDCKKQILDQLQTVGQYALKVILLYLTLQGIAKIYTVLRVRHGWQCTKSTSTSLDKFGTLSYGLHLQPMHQEQSKFPAENRTQNSGT